jgi:amino acid adenylation domain-containing protein
MNESDIQDICPLTPMQEGFLFQSLYDRDSEAYFVQMSFRFKGELRPELFRQTWHMLCARHAVLRSIFVHEGLSRPAQVVLKQRPLEITFTDLRHLAAGKRQQHIAQFQRQDRRRGFNLDRDVLMRIAAFQTRPAEYHVLWSYHHILIDGWSLSILQREFVQIYTALTQGQAPALPAVFPYGNYLRWLESQDREAARCYWEDYLSGYQGLATIPQIGRCRKAQGYALQEVMFELDAATTVGIRALAAQAGVTLNTLVQCVWAIVLARYNDLSEVVFGTIVSGRPPDLAGVENMLGLCINAVPVRIRVEPDRPFTNLLQATLTAALQSQPGHHLPLAEIQALSPLGGQLFDHLLSFENYPVVRASVKTDDPAGATFAIEGLGAHDRTHYPFALIATPGDKLHVRFSFNANVYTEDQMQRTKEHFLTAVRSVLDKPNTSVSHVSILPAGERKQVVHDFNDSRVEQAYEPGLVGRFEAQVKRTPDHTAVAFEDRQLTYRELNERANQLAHYLRDVYQVQPDDRIGLLLDRSEQLLVAIWGILKAGAAYVPIDPGYPPQRFGYMVSDSACRLVITEEKHADKAARGSVSAIADIHRFASGNPQNPRPVTDASHLAYVIYTSGSTGVPKGCQIELGNLAHYLCWAERFYFAGREGGCFGLYSPLSFDLTVTSLYLPLLRGKTLHVFPADAELLDVFDRTFREDSPIDSIKLTPSHISLLRHLRLSRSKVRLCIVGGEAMSMEQVRMLRSLSPQMEIYNEYGPTETTVGCVVKRLEGSDERVLIGKPIANTRVYIMRGLEPMPIGITGEVLIGGAGVGRGYINRDELNRLAFQEDLLLPGQRLYRTGDLGRWLPDGNLELLGRTDQQVKIRGYRIELGEIEHQLVSHAAVQDAVVTARDQNELVAYLTSEGGGINLDSLQEQLTAVLPDYMIPSHFVLLDEFPLTPNGKVDRQALPDPVSVRSGVKGARTVAEPREDVAPRDVHEERLLEIWQDVLGIDRIGVTDNFFQLGGHSLKAMQIASQIHKRLGVKVALRQVFQMPSIAELARVVRSADEDNFVEIDSAPQREYYDLSHAQHRLWLLHHLDGAVAYNIPRAFVFDQAPQMDALSRAFETLIERHEVLRTSFLLVDGEPKQKVLATTAFRLEEIDLRGRAQPEKLARDYVDGLANAPFDLARPPLLRAAVVRLSERRCVFAFNLHHIISDGWSEDIFYREVLALYEAYRNGRPNPLRPLRIQYKDFAVWQNAQGFERQEQYWLRQLADMPDGVRLPYEATPSEKRDFRGGTVTVVLSEDLTAALRQFVASRATTVSTVVLAAFKLFLFRWTGQDDICVGMSIANRIHPDTESLIGFFVNILPIRTRMSADMEFHELLQQVERNCHDAFEHQDYPFDLLVRKLNPARFANRQSILNIVYNYLSHGTLYVDGLGKGGDNRFDTTERIGDSDEWKPFEYTFSTSKFDLTLFVFDDEKNLHLTLEYDSGLFGPATIRQGLATLQRFVEIVAGSPVESELAAS